MTDSPPDFRPKPSPYDSALELFVLAADAGDMLMDITLLTGGSSYQGKLLGVGRYHDMLADSLGPGMEPFVKLALEKFQRVIRDKAEHERQLSTSLDRRAHYIHLLCHRYMSGSSAVHFTPARLIRFRMAAIDGFHLGVDTIE